jgi:5-formyltetrahydrofolate cyclo-ligase
MTRPVSDQDVLRAQVLRKRRAMNAKQRANASRRVCDRILSSRYFLGSQAIACYLSAWDEVDTSETIERAWRANKRIFAPVMRDQREMSFCEIRRDTMLARNSYGLWEPPLSSIINPTEIDTVITPLVAFDKNRHRVGMGSGYFDRAFAFLRTRKTWLRPKLIGLAFDCQEVEKIVPNPWDIQLYQVFSDTY